MSLGYVSPFLVYNSDRTMDRSRRVAVLAAAVLAVTACSATADRPLVDPFRLALPLVEAGSFEIDGQVAGRPAARDGIVYHATRDGSLTAVVVRSQSVLWRFRAGHTLSRGPELGEGRVVLLDDSGALYVLGRDGVPVLTKQIEGKVTTAVREKEGRVYFGTADGAIATLDIASGRTPAWDFRDPSSDAAVTAGPVFAGDLVLFGRSDGKLLAFGPSGELVWQRQVEGAIRADPAFDRGRIFFGTEDRVFYRLKASNGKKVWSRRLQGAPLGPALVVGGKLAVPASNSVVYVLAARGGSILSWQAVASRIVYGLCSAGSVILISSAGPDLLLLDLPSGETLGKYVASGALVAGALWDSSRVVLVEEDPVTGRQRLAFLGSRTVPAPVTAKIRAGSTK